jgi:hypothetical protein
MRRQILVKANVDWDATREWIWKNPDLKPYVETRKGLLVIEPRNPYGVNALVSSHGMVQLTYSDPLKWEEALEIVTPYLIPFSGKRLNPQKVRDINLYERYALGAHGGPVGVTSGATTAAITFGTPFLDPNYQLALEWVSGSYPSYGVRDKTVNYCIAVFSKVTEPSAFNWRAWRMS